MYHFILLFFLLLCSGALAITRNITVSAAAPASAATAGILEYTPSNAWSLVNRPGATTNESYASATAENATIVFNITEPATFFFWRGFPPRTAARYSICIDCRSIDDTGDVLTLDASEQNIVNDLAILFTSPSLANTTHTVFLRNLRNSIAGVVGEITLDSFIVTVEDTNNDDNDNSTVLASAKISTAIVVSAVLGSVLGVAILVALTRFIVKRRFEKIYGENNLSEKGPMRTPRKQARFTLRTDFFRKLRPETRSIWKMKKIQRQDSATTAPMVEKKPWDTRPRPENISTGYQTRNDLPLYQVQPQYTYERRSVPQIMVTSPTTVPTSASTYSTTHDIPLPPPIANSDYDADFRQSRATVRSGPSTRRSDPYVSYAAYAAFAGISDEDDPASFSRVQQSPAVHDSSLISTKSIQQAYQAVQAKTKAPPSSFNDKGIREGPKSQRTLSDKIKRGTLPPPPPEDQRGSRTPSKLIEKNDGLVSNQSRDVGPSNRTRAESPFDDKNSPPEKYDPILKRPPEAVVSPFRKPSLRTPVRRPVPQISPDTRLSFLPGASPEPASVSPPRDAPIDDEDVALKPPRTSLGVENNSLFWSSEGALSYRDSMGADAGSYEGTQATHSNSNESENRRGGRHSKRRSGKSRSQRYSSGSRMTDATPPSIVGSQTPRSSTSYTPLVTDFPMPPSTTDIMRTMGNNSPTTSHGSSPDTNSNQERVNTPSFPMVPIIQLTRASASSNNGLSPPPRRPRTIISPPSAFASSSSRVPNMPLSSSRVRQMGSAAPKSLQSRSTDGSSATSSNENGPKGRSSTKALSNKRSELAYIRDAFAPPTKNARKGQAESEASSKKSLELQRANSVRSQSTEESPFLYGETRVPFYMVDPSSSGTGPAVDRNPSRLTMASTATGYTVTDEDYTTGDVQLMVAHREVPLDLPKAVRDPSPTSESKSKSSNLRPSMYVQGKSGAEASAPESATLPSPGGAWEMVGPPAVAPTRSPNNYKPMATVPVSARSEAFDGRDLEVVRTGASREGSMAYSADHAMPWSVDFEWPNSPSLALHSPSSSPMSSRSHLAPRQKAQSQLSQHSVLSSQIRNFDRVSPITELEERERQTPSPNLNSNSTSSRYPNMNPNSTSNVEREVDYPVSIATTTIESRSNAASNFITQNGSSGVTRDGRNGTWKELTRANSKGRKSNRNSTVSNASTFFGGVPPPSQALPALPSSAILKSNAIPAYTPYTSESFNADRSDDDASGPSPIPSPISPSSPGQSPSTRPPWQARPLVPRSPGINSFRTTPGQRAIGGLSDVFTMAVGSGGSRTGLANPRSETPTRVSPALSATGVSRTGQDGSQTDPYLLATPSPLSGDSSVSYRSDNR